MLFSIEGSTAGVLAGVRFVLIRRPPGRRAYLENCIAAVGVLYILVKI